MLNLTINYSSNDVLRDDKHEEGVELEDDLGGTDVVEERAEPAVGGVGSGDKISDRRALQRNQHCFCMQMDIMKN